MNDFSTNTPIVTVLMSCYNAEAWLRESLESILAQDFENFEAVVINDGSTDRTVDILSDYARKDARIRVIEQQNQGLTAALNTGLSEARGAWIARLDADDVAAPNRLRQQLHVAKLKPQTVFVGSGLILIDRAGKQIAQYRYPQKNRKLIAYLATARRFPAHSTAFFDRKVALRLGGYRLRLKRAQDIDLWLRLSEVGALACCSSPLVGVRKHDRQVSNLDGNRETKIDSRLARVSYWLRQMGHPDPMAGSDEAFTGFRMWLEQEMDATGVFERERIFRKEAQGETGQLRRPGLFLKGVHARLAGDRLPQKFARQWALRQGR